MIEEGFGHHLSRRVLIFEANDTIAVALFEVSIGWIVRIHAHRVIESLQPSTDRLLDNLEVADHLVFVELGGFEDKLHFPGVPVRKLALVRMLGEHVAVFDVDGFTDSVGHKTKKSLPQKLVWVEDKEKKPLTIQNALNEPKGQPFPATLPPFFPN